MSDPAPWTGTGSKVITGNIRTLETNGKEWSALTSRKPSVDLEPTGLAASSIQLLHNSKVEE